MSSGESVYLAFVIAAFLVFCVGLVYGVSATKKASGRDSKG